MIKTSIEKIFMRDCTGLKLVDSRETKVLGTITAHYFCEDDEIAVFMIDDEYTVNAEECDSVIFHSNSNLPTEYIRELY